MPPIRAVCRSCATALLFSVLLLSFPGCKKGPDKSKPWVVVLDVAATRAAAVQRAEELAQAYPEQLEDSMALNLVEKGGVLRHLVVSRGFERKPEAEAFARKLGKSGSAQLQVISITGLRLATDEVAADASAPEEVEFIEKLAAFLPPPSDTLRLESFLLLRDPDKVGRYHLGSFGRAAVWKWALGFGKLGWKGTAEAVYRPRGSFEEEKSVRVFVGWLGPETDGTEAIKKIYSFLWDHRSPTEEEWEQIEEEEEKERKKRRRKRRRRRKRKRKPLEPEAAVKLKEPPPPVDRLLWWGSGKVHLVERVTFVPWKDTDLETPLKTAWITLGPKKQAVILVLFEDEATAKSLMAPRTMGKCSGLAHSVHLKSAWRMLPDVSVEDEEMVYLGMDRLIRRLDRKRRRLDWAKPHGEDPLVAAGYASEDAWWGVSWVDLGSEPVAETAFDAAYIAPRKEKLQKMLKSRRNVNYDMGVSLHEVGDVMGWHFKGAANGRVQELYFRKGAVLWLLQASQTRKGGIQPQDLLARVDLLQIWEEPEE